MKMFNKLVILFFVISVFYITSSVNAVDYNVPGSNFQSIQGIIDSANSGDRILLGSKNYTSSGSIITVSRNKNLTIQGQSNTNRANLNANNLHGILSISEGSSGTIRYVNFINGGNKTHSFSVHGTVLIENCSFSGSRGDSGSGIYVYETANNTIIRNCNFTNNYANNREDNNYTAGGAVCVHGANNVEIRNSIFSGNLALNDGGALVIRNDASNARVINCNFINNQAPNGGAIYNNIASTTITGCTFTNNKASNTGGAIYSRSSLTISNSNFNNNNAKINGGAIYTTGNAINIIKSSKFTNNTGKYGGAIYNNGPMIIESSTFKSNKASMYGGAIYANKNLNISGGSITSNSANYGSAIFNLATLRISKINMKSNIAKVIGIYLKYPSSTKASKKITINVFLKTGNNINDAIYNKKGNTFIDGFRKDSLTYSPSKIFSTSISGSTKNIKSDSKGIASRTFTVPKKAKKVPISASYSQSGRKWVISKTISVSKTSQGTIKTATKTQPNPIKRVSTPKSNSKNNGANIRVSFTNHEYSHLASLVNMDNYLVSSKKISYWNLKSNKNFIGVTDFIYKVDKNGWYYGTINSKMGINWKKLAGKPATSGTWFNLSPSSKDKYSIGKIVPKFDNNTSNVVQMFFLSAKTNINHNSLTPYISYTYNLVNKIDKSERRVRFFEKSDYEIYFKIDDSSKSLKGYNKYLVNSKKAPTNNANIKSLTRNILSKIDGQLTPTKKAKALYLWVRDNINYPAKSYPGTKKLATGTLSSRVANCVDQSSLLISMLRTAMIPSKYIHYKPCKFRSNLVVGHVWVSLFADGKWLEVDTVSKSNPYGKIYNVVEKGKKMGPYIIVPF